MKPVVLSPCQIVSWNLEHQRRAKGWSQVDMAKRLEPFIGYRMSRAAISKAERSVHGGPIRRWNADELFALARIFETPVGDFFLPPEPHFRGRRVMINGIPGEPRARVTAAPLSSLSAQDLTMRIVAPEPASEEERERRAALTKEIIKIFASEAELRVDFRRAFEGAIRGFLEEHPEQLKEILTQGVPRQVFEETEIDLTAARIQKLANRIEDVVEKPGTTKGGERR